MKIFVVVGTLLPFDRLIRAIDIWAFNKTDVIITGQVGKTNYLPQNMKYFESLSAKEFNSCFSESDLIISHAGMGVVLKSLVENKPIIILPRMLELNEATTDHQIATAKALSKMNYVNVAMNIEEMLHYLEKPNEVFSKHKIGEFASGSLIDILKEFINNN
jgi:UDP-N-acetylglucosamine transferase subunit ALG13